MRFRESDWESRRPPGTYVRQPCARFQPLEQNDADRFLMSAIARA